MKSKEERFLELISCIDINNPVMDFDGYGNILYWFDKEGKYVCHYDSEIGWFWFIYEKIWSVFQGEYGLSYSQIHPFINTMVEPHFKFKDVTLWTYEYYRDEQVEQHFKLNGIS